MIILRSLTLFSFEANAIDHYKDVLFMYVVHLVS